MRAWLLRHRCRVFLHRIRFPGQPMFSSAAAQDLVGKHIIVGITYEDQAHRPVRQEQYHGRITRLNLHEGFVIQTPSGAEKTLPPDLRSVLAARPGTYRFRATGEVVSDAELQASWTQPLAPPDEGPLGI
jgi:hypothetical protein